MTRQIDTYIPPMVPYVAWKAFEPEECDKIKQVGELLEFKKAKMGSNEGREDQEYRNTDITWIMPEPQNHWIFDRMNEVVAYLNFMHFQMDLTSFDGFQYSKYKLNGHYKRHTDIIINPPGGLYRKLSMSVMLSEPDEYEGGELVLDASGAEKDLIKVKLKKGEMILFYSHIPHNVEPVIKGTRLALVTWALGEKIR
jgi:PKHD-type hydroxylase